MNMHELDESDWEKVFEIEGTYSFPKPIRRSFWKRQSVKLKRLGNCVTPSLENENMRSVGKIDEYAFYNAVKNGKTSQVTTYLAEGFSVNKKNEFGETALHMAVKCKLVTVVKFLIKRGADVNAPGVEGDTPLHLAVARNQKGEYNDIIRILMKNKPEVRIQNANRQSALECALKHGYISTFKLILKYLGGRDLIIIDTARLASEHGNVDIFKFVFRTFKDVLVTVSDEDGNNILHHAVTMKSIELVRNFISLVDQNKQNNDGETPLHLAVKYGLNEIIGILLAREPDVNMQNNYGNTALHLAVDVSLLSCILLIDITNLSLQNRDGETVLHRACQSPDINYLELAMYKSQPNTFTSLPRDVIKDIKDLQDRFGNTAFHYACEQDEYDMVKTLVEDLCADKGVFNNEGKTGLDVAMEMNHLAIVNLLTDSATSAHFDSWHDYMCGICEEIPLNIIFQCKNGHIYCDDCDCQQPVTRCRKCGVATTDKIRNIELENRLMRLFPAVEFKQTNNDPFESLFTY